MKRSKIFLPKIDWIKFRKSRDFRGKIHETTILQEGENWFVSFSCEWEQERPKAMSMDEDLAIEIDLGFNPFVVTETGRKTASMTSKIQNFYKDSRNVLKACDIWGEHGNRNLSKRSAKIVLFVA